MRLIDADKIKFTEYINGDVTVSKEKIDNQPTAYDIYKVVEAIKTHAKYGLQIDENTREYRIIEECIEVVKQQLKEQKE